MKTEIRERKIIEKQTIYIANDGTEFKTQEDCKKYEESWTCTLKVSFNRIPHTKMNTENYLYGWGGYCNDYIYLIKPRNLDDIRILNTYFNICEQDRFTQDDIGKECVVEVYDDGSNRRYKKGIETPINDIMKSIAIMREELDNFGKEKVESKTESENTL